MQASSTTLPRLCLVEDDDQVREALTTYLVVAGYRVRSFPNAAEFLEFWDWSKGLECLISDVRMAEMDGISLLQQIRQRDLDLPVILVTGHGDVAMAVAAMKAGATDFLLKPVGPQELKSAITSASEANKSKDKTDSAKSAKQKISMLSDRHRQILELVAQGLTSKEIGSILKLSFRTVEAHRAHIMAQLNANTLADIIKITILAGVADGRT